MWPSPGVVLGHREDPPCPADRHPVEVVLLGRARRPCGRRPCGRRRSSTRKAWPPRREPPAPCGALMVPLRTPWRRPSVATSRRRGAAARNSQPRAPKLSHLGLPTSVGPSPKPAEGPTSPSPSHTRPRPSTALPGAWSCPGPTREGLVASTWPQRPGGCARRGQHGASLRQDGLPRPAPGGPCHGMRPGAPPGSW